MAKEQHAEAKNTFDTVVAALPEYSRKLYGTDDVELVVGIGTLTPLASAAGCYVATGPIQIEIN